MIVNDILILLLNIQLLVFLFSSDYLAMILLTNADNAHDLSGRMVIYIIGIACVLVLSFLPVVELKAIISVKELFFPAVLFCELLFTLIFGNTYSPLFAYGRLAEEAIEAAKVRNRMETTEDCTSFFYRTGVSCISVDRPEALAEKPNVVLILTEGLSQHIVTDERDIMPNVKAYESKSINFVNYYNHTFATYRGIIGQLYSGYQMDNYDTNTLIGIQNILSDNGYHTTFINTEPNLVPFAKYLGSMGFDQLISEPGTGYHGPGNSLSDKEAYEKLFAVIEEEAAGNCPFFTVIYTFGTHASFDSPDEKFDEGENSELNKFWNLDYQFGRFMEKVEESDLFDNTLFVFTSVHATYADLYYKMAFPDYVRTHTLLDQIPLLFYYKGIDPEEIDVNGRNSLDLTSTILDYIDVNGPNYFLGASLFHSDDNNNNLDTVFTTDVGLFSSEYADIRELEESAEETKIVQEMIINYFIAKTQKPLK